MANEHGLSYDAPAGFEPVEVMVTLKGPATDDLKDPRAMQSQFPIRPNLILHRREVRPGATVDMLCGELCAELVSAIDGMKNLATGAFAFADDAAGMLVSFDFPAGKAATVRQFQAMRLDGDVFTTATLTVDASTLTDDKKERFFDAIGSIAAPEPRSPGDDA